MGYSYQHSITGARSKKPEDFAGGILADDMGLGKTLTTLTTIVASHDRAAKFGAGASHPNQGMNISSSSGVSQATVVVVPSERKLSDQNCADGFAYFWYSSAEYMVERD